MSKQFFSLLEHVPDIFSVVTLQRHKIALFRNRKADITRCWFQGPSELRKKLLKKDVMAVGSGPSESTLDI
jgi:hypothetical protein